LILEFLYDNIETYMSEETLNNPMGMAYSLGKSVYKHLGNTADPTITFDNDPTIGWYLNNAGEMIFTAQGYDNIVQAPDRTEFLCPVVINEIDEEFAPLPLNHKGILYRKPGSDGLWWKTLTCEVDLTASGNNLALMQSQLESAMSPSIMDPMLLSNGSAKDPTYSFVGSSNTGMYLKNDLDQPSLSFAVNGQETVKIDTSAMRNYTVYEFVDTITEQPSMPTIGKLYKKAGSDGLWWVTSNGEINIADNSYRIEPKAMPLAIIDNDTQDNVENKIIQGENVDLSTIQKNTDLLNNSNTTINVTDDNGHTMILHDTTTRKQQPEVVHESLVSSMFKAQTEGASIAYGFKDINDSGMYFDKENHKLGVSFDGVPMLTLQNIGASFNSRVLVNNYSMLNGRISPQYTFDEALDRGLYISDNAVGLSLYGGLTYVELARDKVSINKDLIRCTKVGLISCNNGLYCFNSDATPISN
jgi:hypothetical protein